MNDEKIGAYLDGELDEAQQRDALTELGANPGAAIRLADIARADKALRIGLAAPSTPHDAALALKLRNGTQFGSKRTQRPWAAAAALAAACVLGAFLGAALQGGAQLPGVHSVSPELAAALETLPSGDTRAIAGGSVTLAQSIETASGYCRQFQLSDRNGASDALACREGGQWTIALLAPAHSEAGAGFSTAGAQETALDATLEALGSPAFVDPAEEAELIDRGWRAQEMTR